MQCSPPPPMQKRSNKTRKTKSAALTYSQYKRLAEERRRNKKDKKGPVANKVSKRNTPKPAPQPIAGPSGLQKQSKATAIDDKQSALLAASHMPCSQQQIQGDVGPVFGLQEFGSLLSNSGEYHYECKKNYIRCKFAKNNTIGQENY